jgi:hypothetical protein
MQGIALGKCQGNRAIWIGKAFQILH